MAETLVIAVLFVVVPPILAGLLVAKHGMMAGYIILAVGACVVLGFGVSMTEARNTPVPLNPAFNLPLEFHGVGGFSESLRFAFVVVPSVVFTVIAVLIGRAAHRRAEVGA